MIRKIASTFRALGLGVLAGWVPLQGAGMAITNYTARGILKQNKIDERVLVIQHEAISNYMDAMTMPFRVKEAIGPKQWVPGDKIEFQLHVTANESWIDHLKKLERSGLEPAAMGSPDAARAHEPGADPRTPPGTARNPMRFYQFTNQLNQPVSLADFRGQAIALTFFFTRCPIPEFCPRLSRNFQEVQRKLTEMPNAPTNWHLISVTFDPRHDTAKTLKAYADLYQADSRRWSFLTGPPDKIAALAKLCDVKFDPEGAFYNHNFRTLIIDAANRLQMVFPTSGDLSDSIVQELLKAAAATNHAPIQTSARPSAPSSQGPGRE